MPATTIYHRMKALNTRMIANYQRGFGPTPIVLLLTTTGRKPGLLRKTSLHDEEEDGDYCIASARGANVDWFKDILANPKVHVQIRDLIFDASAESVTDHIRIADFFELRLKRHPIMKFVA
jgi:deazaflavin-dependent oxidoreductase (nitroreductase family)